MTTDTLVANPQLEVTARYHHGVGNCIACAGPFEPRAQYAIIFTSSPRSPEVLASAHYDPPAGGAYVDEDDDGMLVRPCLDQLERMYDAHLAAAGMLRYAPTPHSFTLTSAGRPVDCDWLEAGGQTCAVLLAAGRWAYAVIDTANISSDIDSPRSYLRVRYRPTPSPAPSSGWAPVTTPALLRLEPVSAVDHLDTSAPAGILRLGDDAGGPRWYLGNEPMHAGEPLEVHMGRAGWVTGRIETTDGGSRAHLHVPLAGAGYDVVLPPDASVRPVQDSY